LSTITLEKEAVITAAAPLTESEANALLTLAATTEKTPRVKGGIATQNRAWSRGGRVD